jgi:protein-S-isoprenylcysteine O-methyltransferase Ste14
MDALQGFAPVLMDDGFSITNFLSGAVTFLQEIGGYVVLIAGVILLIVGVVQIAKGLAGGGKGQTNWAMSIGCLVAGGALCFGGWALITNLSQMAGGAVNEMEQAGRGAGDDAWRRQEGGHHGGW